MSEFGEHTHPLASDVATINQALQAGMSGELPYWGLVKGFDVSYVPSEASTDGTSLLRLEPFAHRSAVEYQFAPAMGESNPLAVIEADEHGDIQAIAVIARMVVNSQAYLIPIGKRDGLTLATNTIQVDVTANGAVISFNESTGVEPICGEYDDAGYGYIRRKSNDQLQMGYVVEFARQYLAA